MADTKNDNPWVGCASVIVAAVILGFGYRACSRQEDDLQAKRDKAAIELEASDKSEAAARGMSVDEYREARWASNAAYAACKTTAEGRAKHAYKSDWIPDRTWDVKGKIISVVGKDLQMQNGFGVYSRVTYFCDYDMDKRAVVDLVISEN